MSHGFIESFYNLINDITLMYENVNHFYRKMHMHITSNTEENIKTLPENRTVAKLQKPEILRIDANIVINYDYYHNEYSSKTRAIKENVCKKIKVRRNLK